MTAGRLWAFASALAFVKLDSNGMAAVDIWASEVRWLDATDSLLSKGRAQDPGKHMHPLDYPCGMTPGAACHRMRRRRDGTRQRLQSAIKILALAI